MQRHLRLAMAVLLAGLIAVLAAAPDASAKPKPTTTTTTTVPTTTTPEPSTTTTEPSTTTTEPSTTSTEPSTATTEPTLVADDLSTLVDDPDNSWLYVGVYPTYPLCTEACGQILYFDCEGLFGPAAACDDPEFLAYWYWGG